MPTQNEAEIIAETPELRVRILTLNEGGSLKWHYHSSITDNTFCLSGKIEIRMREPDETHVISPGKRCEILPKRPHTVINRSESQSKYLLIQGVGEYDFNPA